MPKANNPKNGHTALKERPKAVAVVPSRRIRADNSGGLVASHALTDDELKLITVNFQRKAPLNINTAKATRGEMIRVYDMVTSGELPLSAGMKLIYMLDKITRSRLEEDKLEILRKGGIQGAVFVGLILEGPGDG